MYHIKYITKESKILVYRGKTLVHFTKYIFPDSIWFDFSFGKTNYSVQILPEELQLWAGIWNVSKVYDDTRIDNQLKSDFEIIN